MTVEFAIDYFRITVHAPLLECERLFNDCFSVALGSLSDLPHGAKGFKGVKGGLLGFQLKHTPGANREYCCFEFPGKACGSIAPEQFKDFYFLVTNSENKHKVTHIDLAFDNASFTPKQFHDAIVEDFYRAENEEPIIRSLAQRENLDWHSQALKMREDGSGRGKDTCYFGSRSSERFIRVYNKRGPTRVEFEVKGERAVAIAAYLMYSEIDEWPQIAIANIKDFIDIYYPWWDKFIGDEDRAYMKLNCGKEVELERSKEWLIHQVAPALAAVAVCTDGEFLIELDNEGRKRMNKRYGPLLSAHGKQ